MIAESKKNKTQPELKPIHSVIIQIIHERTGGVSLNEILTVMQSQWARVDKKEITVNCIWNHIFRMMKSDNIIAEVKPSKNHLGKIRYYSVGKNPLPPHYNSKIYLSRKTEKAEEANLLTVTWAAPRTHIPRKPNPLHQIGGAV